MSCLLELLQINTDSKTSLIAREGGDLHSNKNTPKTWTTQSIKLPAHCNNIFDARLANIANRWTVLGCQGKIFPRTAAASCLPW